MGIDPKNHRADQRCHCMNSKRHDNQVQDYSLSGEPKISSTVSCSLPDLNLDLDLNISLPLVEDT